MADVVENIKKNVRKLKKVEESSKESSASIDNNKFQALISSTQQRNSLMKAAIAELKRDVMVSQDFDIVLNVCF